MRCTATCPRRSCRSSRPRTASSSSRPRSSMTSPPSALRPLAILTRRPASPRCAPATCRSPGATGESPRDALPPAPARVLARAAGPARAAEVRAVRAAHASSCLSEGHDEDAVEEFLRAHAGAGEPRRGTRDRARHRPPRLRRAPSAGSPRSTASADGSAFAVAEMMLALGREDYARCGRVADRLHMVAERQRLARASQRAAG